MTENEDKYLEFSQIIRKYFNKDFSHKAIIYMLEKKYGIQTSLRTLSRILSRYGMKRKNIVESPSEQIVLALLMELRGSGCKLGYRFMWKRLRNVYKLKVKQKTVMAMLRVLDPEGVEARSRYRLKRRIYSVAGSNFMWHADNHDKLKRYGFPMYGIIDGFSKKVLLIEFASTNNQPEIIAYYYLQLLKKQQCLPTRLRTDKGTEAVIMGELQMALRFHHNDSFAGLNSHIKGKSTHNQRIESYWRRFQRKQKGRDIPGGKPNELYHWPEKFEGQQCKQMVNLEHVDICLNEFAEIPHFCPPHFIELVEFVMPGTQKPSKSEEAFHLYEILLEAINAEMNRYNSL